MDFYVCLYSNLLVPCVIQPNNGNLDSGQCGKLCLVKECKTKALTEANGTKLLE
jgi:hypothetical protein